MAVTTKGDGFRASIFTLTKGSVQNLSGSGAPTNGTSGTGAGKSNLGSHYRDYTNGVTWENVGTKASPTWSPITPRIFSVSSTNILNMFTTPVNLIAAPPTGFSIIINNICFVITRTATAYASGGVVTFIYTGSVAAHTGSVPAATVTGGAATVLTQLGPGTGANGIVVPTATGVDITNATGAFTTGTGTGKAIIDYRVIRQA